ncbi:transposase family protein [Actinomyces bowdenii]|nr:transposase family protein [Actinomyces bowdenii]MBO3724967.1 transposase family protein [Actinomyces bowdenii]
MLSSATTALSRQPLTQALQEVIDPRDRRDVRHDLPTILSLTVTGVPAGRAQPDAIREHATDLSTDELEALGPPRGQVPFQLQQGRSVPSMMCRPARGTSSAVASTIPRTLAMIRLTTAIAREIVGWDTPMTSAIAS